MYARFVPCRPVEFLSPHLGRGSAHPGLDGLTGLATPLALKTFLRLTERAGVRVTLVHLSWKGEKAPSVAQVCAVANAVGACKDDAALAARLSDTHFTVVLETQAAGALTFLARLWKWLGPHTPLGFSLEEFPSSHSGQARAA